MKKLSFVFALLTFLTTSPAHALGLADSLDLSPFWKWKVIETEHFRLTFPEQLTDTAERAANDLEEAHAVLSKELYWTSPRKVPILLIDNADSANGLTSPIERFGIALIVTPPDNWMSTAYYDDWLRLLCFHEYTHFLNMDAARGLWKVGRYLFGDVTLPTSTWPSWMLEGLAVYNETRYTHGGRGRSPFYEMILRAAVNEQVLDTNQGFTLDRFNSLSVPYYPDGEAVYLYGYHLMDEVAKDNTAGPTADGKGTLKSGQDALGVMSYRSSLRVPYFINGNLENITGRDWYSYWDQFVSETRKRGKVEIDQIKTQPVTETHAVTHDPYQFEGSSFSPDGKWMAFTGEAMYQENSLFLRDLKTGKDHVATEKVVGAEVSFTPDSKFVIFSSLKRQSEYYLYSELGAYSVDHDSITWLTSKARARDPDVSHDGKKVTFTVVEGQAISVVEAALLPKGKTLELGPLHKLYSSAQYDVASTPKYSADDKQVFFSLHRNGHVSEDLMSVDVASGSPTVLVDNGKFNRYPSVTKDGTLLFVSDLTGVDNLYRYHPGAAPELVTNLITGIAFPSTDTQGKVYASVFSAAGWDIAQVDLLNQLVDPSKVTIAPVPAPAPDSDSDAKNNQKKYDVVDYSLIPSIYPRAWIPYATFTPGNFSFGESVIGYDATDRHSYGLNLGYDTLSSSLDWFAEYQNRSFGPTLTFAASDQLTYSTFFNGSIYSYTRDTVFTLAAEYPFLKTFSSLTPTVAFYLDRTQYFFPGANTPTRDYNYETRYLPTMDVLLGNSSAQRSRLAISPEEGRDLQVGVRYYIDNGNGTQVEKGLFTDTEYIRLGNSHFVLVPSVQASYSTANPATNTNLNSDVVLQGHLPTIIGGFASSSLTELPIRGYPGTTFYVKAAEISALDLRFPIGNIFRGWGTNPFYLDQIYGFVFGEATYLPYGPEIFTSSPEPKILPSTGGGINFSLEAFIDVPITVAIEYHYGFRPEAGGAGELFTSIQYTGITF
jgi:Tol biopolymer transport system component